MSDRRSKTYIAFDTTNLREVDKKAIERFRKMQKEDKQITNRAFFIFSRKLFLSFCETDLSFMDGLDFILFKLRFRWLMFTRTVKSWLRL